jgi:TetR/AcrR family transcriptional regulator, transcriptional repressor for nem operon
VGFSRLFQSWLAEAEKAGLLKSNLDYREISNFFVITLNGAATLYMSTRDGAILQQTNDQLRFFIRQLRKNRRVQGFEGSRIQGKTRPKEKRQSR